MNKKMFIICLLFVLISSCKTDESKEEKSLDNILDDIGLEVEKLVQADEAPKKAGNKDGGGGAVAGAAAVGGAGGAVVAAGGVPGAGAGGGAVAGAGDNIKKQIAELKNKINSADSKKISLQKYREYEEEVKKLREKIKELNNGNNGNDAELKETDPISGWFVYLLLISGCRGSEMQKVKMQDISTISSKTGEIFYNIKVNVAKKRNATCIREIVINSKEYAAIQKAHKNYFEEKNLDTRRTYLFQKTKHRFKDNRISIINISKKFKNLLKKSGFRANKSLHLCRNFFISNLKSNGYNSFQIKELMKYSSTSEIDNIYGLSPANKIEAYKCIKNNFKL